MTIRFRARLVVFLVPAFAALACGGGSKDTTPAAMVANRPARNAAPADRPKNLAAWVHVDDLAAWHAAYDVAKKGIDKASTEKLVGSLQIPEDETKKQDAANFAALAATIRPGQPCDLGAIFVGQKEISVAVVFPINDEASFRRALALQYDLKKTNDGYVISDKPKHAGDGDDEPLPASPKKHDKHEKKQGEGKAKEPHCRILADHAVCGFEGPAPKELGAWLESKPVPEGTSGNSVVAQLFASHQLEDIADELASTPKAAPFLPFLRHFDTTRIDVRLGLSDLSASMKVVFHTDPSLAPWFAPDPKRATPSRVFTQWPRDATISMAEPSLAQWLPLFRDALADEPASPIVMRAIQRPLAYGTVVERSELARVVAEIDAAGSDAVKLKPKKEELRALLEGYMLIGISESGDGGGPITLKELVETHTKDRPKEKARAAKGLPNAMFIEQQTSGLDVVPKGTLFVNDGKGVLWWLSDNNETYLVAAAKRLMGPPPEATSGFAPFTPETVANASWNTSFGSYWSIGFADAGAGALANLGSLGDPLSDATKKKPVVKKPTGLTDAEVTMLKAHAEEVKKVLATPPKRIPIAIVTKSSPPSLEIDTSAPLTTWSEGMTNAAGPMSLLAFPLMIAAAGLLGKD